MTLFDTVLHDQIKRLNLFKCVVLKMVRNIFKKKKEKEKPARHWSCGMIVAIPI